MVLYKNVDLCDLESILHRGILSADEAENRNWEEGKRAGNRTDAVYLFYPTGVRNSFCRYGIALLEVELPESEVSVVQMQENDANEGLYREFTAKRVPPECIRAVYIPEVFRSRVHLPSGIRIPVVFCPMSAKVYEHGFVPATRAVLDRFAQTAQIECSSEFNFFRGVGECREAVDLYDVVYEM